MIQSIAFQKCSMALSSHQKHSKIMIFGMGVVHGGFQSFSNFGIMEDIVGIFNDFERLQSTIQLRFLKAEFKQRDKIEKNYIKLRHLWSAEIKPELSISHIQS